MKRGGPWLLLIPLRRGRYPPLFSAPWPVEQRRIRATDLHRWCRVTPHGCFLPTQLDALGPPRRSKPIWWIGRGLAQPWLGPPRSCDGRTGSAGGQDRQAARRLGIGTSDRERRAGNWLIGPDSSRGRARLDGRGGHGARRHLWAEKSMPVLWRGRPVASVLIWLGVPCRHVGEVWAGRRGISLSSLRPLRWGKSVMQRPGGY